MASIDDIVALLQDYDLPLEPEVEGTEKLVKAGSAYVTDFSEENDHVNEWRSIVGNRPIFE